MRRIEVPISNHSHAVVRTLTGGDAAPVLVCCAPFSGMVMAHYCRWLRKRHPIALLDPMVWNRGRPQWLRWFQWLPVLQQVIPALSWRQWHLVTWSAGGYAGPTMTRAPGCVSWVWISGPLRKDMVRGGDDASFPDWVTHLRRLPGMGRAIRILPKIAALDKRADPLFAETVLTELAALPVQTLTALLRDAAAMPIRPKLAQSPVPIALCWGTRDPLISHRSQLSLVRRASIRSHLAVGGATHFLPVEYAEAAALFSAEFFRDKENK